MRIIYIMPKVKKKCGKYKCCYCPGEAPAYSGASGLWYHMHRCHPNKCKSKRTYKNRKRDPVAKTKKERKKVNIKFSVRDNDNIFNFADNQDYGLEEVSDSEVPLNWLSGPKNTLISERSIDSKWLDINTNQEANNLEKFIKSYTKSRRMLNNSRRPTPYSPSQRKKILESWRERRKRRNWTRKPKNPNRQKVAAGKKRVKGRFTKKGGKKKRRKKRRKRN